jgi:co-chaperonin GroES (HSP10)
MAVNLTPLHDRVIVRRIEEKESVKGGIKIEDEDLLILREEEILAKLGGQAKAAKK